MRQRTREVINLLIVVFLLMAAIGIGLDARATGRDDANVDVSVPVDVTTGDTSLTTGPTNVSVGGTFVRDDSVSNLNFDSKALALANSLGDVDIRECLGSTQWNTPLYGKQKLVLNQVCMAEFYLKQGKYQLAGQALCNQPEIIAEYDTEAACELAHDFTPVFVTIPVEITETFEDEQQVQDAEIEFVQMAQTELYERVAALEQKPPPRPRVVQAAPIDPYSDEKVNAVWAALVGEDEDER